LRATAAGWVSGSVSHQTGKHAADDAVAKPACHPRHLCTKFRREDEGLFISITSRVGPSGKTGTSPHPGRCISSNDTKERPMLKPLIAATAALLVATSAFAQTDKMKSSDSSEYSSAQKKMQKTSEQKMKKSKASTAKGASESAPGTTTGSAAKKY
jgi:hypothetical protein